MLGIYRDVRNIRNNEGYIRIYRFFLGWFTVYLFENVYYYPKIRYLRSKSKYLIIYRPINIVVLGLLTLYLEKPIHTVIPNTQICPGWTSVKLISVLIKD